jgi:hypothetical protein
MSPRLRQLAAPMAVINQQGWAQQQYEVQGRRTAMGTYNFAGDVGKVVFPALLSGMFLVVSWRGLEVTLPPPGSEG